MAPQTGLALRLPTPDRIGPRVTDSQIMRGCSITGAAERIAPCDQAAALTSAAQTQSGYGPMKSSAVDERFDEGTCELEDLHRPGTG